MKYLIVNADDLGISEGTNLAIRDVFLNGVLTSASLMATGPAFHHALECVIRPNPSLGIGLHLCLTSGRSVLAPHRIPLLVDTNGSFCHGFGSLWRLVSGDAREALDQIEAELDAQFQLVATNGVGLDHVDGHRHIHMIPPIFRIVSVLARRYGCAGIRDSDEPLMPCTMQLRLRSLLCNLPKKVLLSSMARRNRGARTALQSPDRTFGIIESGCMDLATLQRIVAYVKPGASEIITHPGQPNATTSSELDSADRTFLASTRREQERAALVSTELREAIDRHGVCLRRYADITQATAATN